MLQVEDLSVRHGGLTILEGVQLHVRPGEWWMVAGPNGAGKTTLINAVARGVPHTGRVLLQGRDVAGQKPAALARQMGVLAQANNPNYSFTVEEVVRLGRYAWQQGLFAAPCKEDNAKVEEALQMTGMASLRHQSVLTLSGGELQRAFLAQVLAQSPNLLLLDEPANHLDLVYQQQVFDMIEKWRGQQERAVVSVVHDLSLAKAYGTHALLLHEGRVVAQGLLPQVLTAQNLNRVYGMDVPAWMRRMLAQWQDS